MSPGLAKWTSEVFRSKNIWGYVPEEDESFLFAMIIATESPGLYSFTRDGIDSLEEVELVDAFTGEDGITALADEDYLLKEIWLNFSEPIRFQMEQDLYEDISCECYIPAFTTTTVQGLPLGWSRAQVEAITAESITYMRVKNLGAEVAYGKAWIVGYRKVGLYEWT